MRMHRILVAVLTIALIGLVSSPAEAAKPRRDIFLKGIEADGDVFLKGRVDGTKRGKVIVQTKLKKQTNWGPFRTLRTNAQGGFSLRLPGPATTRGSKCYKVIVPGNDRYRTTIKLALDEPENGLPICVVKRL